MFVTEITDKITVEEFIVSELCLRRLKYNQAKQALQFARREIGDFYENGHANIELKQGGYAVVKDFWSTPATLYTEKTLKGVRTFVEFYVFEWLVNQLNSRS